MRVMISWSGRRAHRTAVALHAGLLACGNAVTPWVSSEDISSGKAWQDAILDQLSGADFGVLCVTPENFSAPWLLFEAGALALRVHLGTIRGVCPVLVDLPLAHLSDTHPLRRFQMRASDEIGIRRLFGDILERSGDDALVALGQHAYNQRHSELTSDPLMFELEEIGGAMLVGQSLSAYHTARMGALLASDVAADERSAGLFRMHARIVAATPFAEIPPSTFQEIKSLLDSVNERTAPALASKYAGKKP